MLILLGLCLVFATSCQKTDKRDYTGTYVGHIRGKSLSMSLSQPDKTTIKGTIFDRRSTYLIHGEIIGDGIRATATDTVSKTEFSIEGSWKGDTLTFMMAMTKPMQTTRSFPVNFLKVVISTNQKGLEELADLGLLQSSGGRDTANGINIEANKSGLNAGKVKSDSEITEHNFPGLWQIVSIKGKASTAFRQDAYYLFNSDKSILKLDRTAVPLDGYYWNIGENKLFLFYKINGRMDEVRPDVIEYSNDLLRVKDGESEIELKKYTKG
ncbi:MAG TPA: hypothetical protein PLC76_12995 [Saprospiraceae bacterium]|jgi:hypothetical protein|nr:hypothetical protein [Saprospiraceae bacterium]HRP85631.1 hypothetical protein [Saprospiraceae bacterium]